MKIFCVLVVTFFSQMVLTQPASDTKLNQFTVLGSVELKERADRASMVFSIKGVGSTLRQAVETADKKTKALTDKLIALGIKERDISTSEFYSGENFGDKAFLSSGRDYRATISTAVRIDSLKLLQPVIFAISEAEVQNLSDVAFSLKDEVSFRRRARTEAGLKAREKAEDIAKALGVVVGKVIAIEEVPFQQANNPMSNTLHLQGGRIFPNPFNPVTVLSEATLDESKGSGFFAQTVSVTSQIRVTFELK